jgi:hypothetical protein
MRPDIGLTRKHRAHDSFLGDLALAAVAFIATSADAELCFAVRLQRTVGNQAAIGMLKPRIERKDPKP